MDGILSEKAHTAKKDYDCTLCDGFILEGNKYTRAYWKPEWADYGDKPIDAKFCTRCHTPPTKLTASPDGPDGYDYIRNAYGVWVQVGQRIEVAGVLGTVVRPNGHEHYVHFLCDGERHPKTAHPTWETVYFNDDGSIAADYRKAKTACG